MVQRFGLPASLEGVVFWDGCRQAAHAAPSLHQRLAKAVPGRTTFTTMKSLFLPLAFAAVAPLASAELSVRVLSATAPGTSTAQVVGQPGQRVLLFISATEAQTQISDLITLDINPLRQLAAEVTLGLTLNAQGTANFSFATTQALTGGRLTFQAAALAPSPEVSNICRATYLGANSLGPALGNAVSAFGQAFALSDGRVALVGGAGPVVSAFDPCTQEVAPIGLVPSANLFAARAQLADGRILVAGGIGAGGQPSTEAYLFDPATALATALPPLATPRLGAAAVRRGDGKILVTGGIDTTSFTDVAAFFGAIENTTELFDPETSTFAPGPNMPEPKAFHTATRLANNAILVAGGLGVVQVIGVPYVSNLGYVSNTAGTSFGALPKLFSTGRFLHDATRLADGRVLLSGGLTADLGGVLKTGDFSQIAFTSIATTSLYSTSGLGSFANGPTLSAPRALHSVAALNNGRALLSGGISGALDIGAILSGTISLPAAVSTTELVSTTAARLGPTMSAPRVGGVALGGAADGRAYIFGGGPTSIELYQP
ncbi:MAG: hypothetical protein RL112_3 [Planctomycetota bacterium]